MMRKAAHRITRVWIFLVLLTLLSMMTSHADAAGIAGSGVVLAAAVAKGRWMALDYLKFRHVPSGWRALVISWLVIVATTAWIAAALPLLRS